jgi:hypothetical protein
MIQSAFYDRTNIVATLSNDCIQILVINRFKNNSEGYKQKNRQKGNDQNHTTINRGSEFNVVIKNNIACIIFVFSPEKHVVNLLEVLVVSAFTNWLFSIAKYKKNWRVAPVLKIICILFCHQFKTITIVICDIKVFDL